MLRSDKDAEIPFPPRNFLSIRALALALLLPLLLACESESDETDREMEALVALYNATGGPDWEWNDNWLSDKPLGEWAGVVTDANGRVIRLDLGYNGLGGEIPPELGSLGSVVNCIFPSFPISVIPAEAGIQNPHQQCGIRSQIYPDPYSRRNDGRFDDTA